VLPPDYEGEVRAMDRYYKATRVDNEAALELAAAFKRRADFDEFARGLRQAGLPE